MNKEKSWYSIGEPLYAYIRSVNRIEQVNITSMYRDEEDGCIYYGTKEYRNLKQGRDLNSKIADLKDQVLREIEKTFNTYEKGHIKKK